MFYGKLLATPSSCFVFAVVPVPVAAGAVGGCWWLLYGAKLSMLYGITK